MFSKMFYSWCRTGILKFMWIRGALKEVKVAKKEIMGFKVVFMSANKVCQDLEKSQIFGKWIFFGWWISAKKEKLNLKCQVMWTRANIFFSNAKKQCNQTKDKSFQKCFGKMKAPLGFVVIFTAKFSHSETKFHNVQHSVEIEKYTPCFVLFLVDKFLPILKVSLNCVCTVCYIFQVWVCHCTMQK